MEAELGLYEQAEAHLTRALGILSESRGRESADTVLCRAMLADLYIRSGDFIRANHEAQTAISIADRHLPGHYAVLLRALAAYSRSMLGQGNWAEAEKASTRAFDLLDLFGTRLPSGHQYAEMLEDYARVLQALGRATEAAECRTKAEKCASTRWRPF